MYICGVALDYCVAYTAIDAASLGYDTAVVLDACRGVNEATVAAMLATMREAGVRVVTVADVSKEMAAGHV